MIKTILVIAGCGIPFFAGLFFHLKRRRLVRTGETATGEVVDLQGSGEDVYPVIRFKMTGQVVVHRYRVSNQAARVGDKMNLYYNPDKPEQFILNSKVEKWLPLLLMFFSIVFGIIYFLFFL